MNICMLTSEFAPDLGGISYYVLNLSRKLLERGHKITIVTRGTWRKSYHEEIDGISVYRVRFVPSYPSPFWLHGIWVNRLFNSLEPHIDLLHVHGSLVPVIHTSVPVVATNHGTTKKDIDNMPVKSFHFLVVKLLSGRLLNAERALLNSANVITAVSLSCATEIREYHLINKEITVVSNGVDSAFFVPAKNKDTDNPYILYSGRLETRKGLATLVESAKFVCKQYPNTNFMLVGKGTIGDYLKKMASRLSLENNFHFVGHVSDRNKLLQYYQSSTVYVLPSYYEGLPTALLEAMSCGIPVVATNVEGSSEVINSGETGLLVSPRDPEKLAEAILKLLDNEELRKQVGLKAREHIKNNYDWEIITDRIEEIYKSAIKAKANG